MEIDQEILCKYCEDNIIEGSSMTAHFQCEGKFCEEAKENYIDDNITIDYYSII